MVNCIVNVNIAEVYTCIKFTAIKEGFFIYLCNFGRGDGQFGLPVPCTLYMVFSPLMDK